jgi:hypothetical protein
MLVTSTRPRPRTRRDLDPDLDLRPMTPSVAARGSSGVGTWPASHPSIYPWGLEHDARVGGSWIARWRHTTPSRMALESIVSGTWTSGVRHFTRRGMACLPRGDGTKSQRSWQMHSSGKAHHPTGSGKAPERDGKASVRPWHTTRGVHVPMSWGRCASDEEVECPMARSWCHGREGQVPDGSRAVPSTKGSGASPHGYSCRVARYVRLHRSKAVPLPTRGVPAAACFTPRSVRSRARPLVHVRQPRDHWHCDRVVHAPSCAPWRSGNDDPLASSSGKHDKPWE